MSVIAEKGIELLSEGACQALQRLAEPFAATTSRWIKMPAAIRARGLRGVLWI